MSKREITTMNLHNLSSTISIFCQICLIVPFHSLLNYFKANPLCSSQYTSLRMNLSYPTTMLLPYLTSIHNQFSWKSPNTLFFLNFGCLVLIWIQPVFKNPLVAVSPTQQILGPFSAPASPLSPIHSIMNLSVCLCVASCNVFLYPCTPCKWKLEL